jgi:molybdate transport system ATP-binding protein
VIDIDVKIDLNMPSGKREAHYKLHIDSDEFITLFGKSGAGKTTLLRLIAGLEKPKNGTIVVAGEVWFDSFKKINLPPQKRSIGFVFQEYALFPTMTIKQNLLYADKNGDATGLLEMMELTELADKKPHELSGGQKQRVALARALMRRPKILLLDEPLSALDHTMRQKLQDELMIVHNKLQITTLMVSHDISETIKLSDKVVMIENGKVERYDTPINIFGEENDCEIFGEIIKVENNKITLLVGTKIVSMDLDDTSKCKVGDMMGLKISLH